MKYFLLFLLTCVMAVGLYAQSKKGVTLVGVQTGINSPLTLSNSSIKNIKIGLPSFSYSASVERRFSIHNKLNFSLRYSMNFVKQNRIKAQETTNYLNRTSPSIGSSLDIHTIYQVTQRTSLSAGIGMNNALKNFIDKSDKPNSKLKSNTFGLNDLNPSLILGIENSTKLFNKNLYYSLQYNFGFSPSIRNLRTEFNETTPSNYTQGLYFGLKYKY